LQQGHFFPGAKGADAEIFHKLLTNSLLRHRERSTPTATREPPHVLQLKLILSLKKRRSKLPPHSGHFISSAMAFLQLYLIWFQ
jgi:hypothetical protein